MLRALLALASVSLLPAGAFANLEQNTLQRDPFAKSAEALKKQSSGTARGAVNQPPARRWRPTLTATIVAGDKSMVQIDGEVLLLGQDIDGYRLVEVARYSATFSRGGRRYTVELYDNN